jgi:hypothetical protein
MRDFDAADLEEKLPACVSTLNGLLESGLSSLFRRCRPVTHSSDRVPLLAVQLELGPRRCTRHTMPTRSPNIDAIRLATVAR